MSNEMFVAMKFIYVQFKIDILIQVVTDNCDDNLIKPLVYNS